MGVVAEHLQPEVSSSVIAAQAARIPKRGALMATMRPADQNPRKTPSGSELAARENSWRSMLAMARLQRDRSAEQFEGPALSQ